MQTYRAFNGLSSEVRAGRARGLCLNSSTLGKTPDLSVERGVVRMARDATRIGLSRRLVFGRRALRMMIRGL